MDRNTTTQFSMGDWEVTTMVGGLPAIYDEYLSHAKYVEQIEIKDTEQTGVWFFALRNIQNESKNSWPTFVIAQRYDPAGWGFTPASLLIPDTSTLFLGAGTRILIFDLAAMKRITEDYTNVGFWGWELHEDIILMSSELEFAAWDKKGLKLWSTFVEPPWSYKVHGVHGDQVLLDIMGRKSSFDLRAGP